MISLLICPLTMMAMESKEETLNSKNRSLELSVDNSERNITTLVNPPIFLALSIISYGNESPIFFRFENKPSYLYDMSKEIDNHGQSMVHFLRFLIQVHACSISPDNKEADLRYSISGPSDPYDSHNSSQVTQERIVNNIPIKRDFIRPSTDEFSFTGLKLKIFIHLLNQ